MAFPVGDHYSVFHNYSYQDKPLFISTLDWLSTPCRKVFGGRSVHVLSGDISDETSPQTRVILAGSLVFLCRFVFPLGAIPIASLALKCITLLWIQESDRTRVQYEEANKQREKADGLCEKKDEPNEKAVGQPEKVDEPGEKAVEQNEKTKKLINYIESSSYEKVVSVLTKHEQLCKIDAIADKLFSKTEEQINQIGPFLSSDSRRDMKKAIELLSSVRCTQTLKDRLAEKACGIIEQQIRELEGPFSSSFWNEVLENFSLLKPQMEKNKKIIQNLQYMYIVLLKFEQDVYKRAKESQNLSPKATSELITNHLTILLLCISIFYSTPEELACVLKSSLFFNAQINYVQYALEGKESEANKELSQANLVAQNFEKHLKDQKSSFVGNSLSQEEKFFKFLDMQKIVYLGKVMASIEKMASAIIRVK